MISQIQVNGGPGQTPAYRIFYGDDGSTIPYQSDGTRWGLFDLQGWNNGPPVKQAIIDRPFHDGVALAPFSYGARVFDLHGGFTAPDRNTMIAAARWLKAAFNVRDDNYGPTLKTLFVSEFVSAYSGAGFTVNVRPAAEVEVKPAGVGHACEFSVPLIAPDPRKYAYVAQSQSATGSGGIVIVPITGAGDMALFVPVLTISGPVTNPRVTSTRTNTHIQFNGTLGSGATIIVNMDTHTVGGTGGFGRDDMDVTSQWFPLLPGAQQLQLSGGGITGVTQLTAAFNDAFS